MKQKLSFAAVLLTAMFMSSAVMAQNKQRTDPDHAQYSIIGTMSFDKGSGKRYLNDAQGKRIQFEYVTNRLASPTMAADLVVRFDSVETTHPGGMTKLDFWRYDEEVGEWIYDSEVRQGENELESTMKTNIMLVIDNSKSLKDDFKKVQDAAIEFVGQLYRESNGKDIFRVGVIGFSTVRFTKVRNITPLDPDNYRGIVSFIRGLEMQNGTAFYYSLETALNMLETDATNNIGKEAYKESRIYAFTDGLDQASVDDSRDLSTPTKYFDYLKPMMKGIDRKRIMGFSRKTVNTTIVTVRGDDMTDKQERLFDQRAQEICDKVRKLKDMSQLVSEFKQLAKDLVNSNYVLYCYIPVGASGRVGWTFAEDHVACKPPKEKKPNKFWLGLGIEGGPGYNDKYNNQTHQWDYHESFHGGVRADVAYPLCSWFAVGGTLSVGINDFELGCRIGPLLKFSFSNGAAFIAGAGFTSFGDGNGGAYMTLGVKFRSPWYINASANALGGEVGGGFGYSFGIGYSILGGK